MTRALPVDIRDVHVVAQPVEVMPADPHAELNMVQLPTTEEIAALAFALYMSRGSEHGHDMEDWLTAEQMLRDKTAN